MKIKEIKKKLGIKNAEIAKMFGYKNTMAYNTSTGKKEVERSIVSLYEASEKFPDLTDHYARISKEANIISESFGITHSLEFSKGIVAICEKLS